MLKMDREKEILHTLEGMGCVSVHELSEKLYTSESTIRRILGSLEHRGLIRRTYGGAELIEKHTHASVFSDRFRENMVSKQEIARKAAAIVPEGSTVFLDQSSTSYFLAAELAKKKQLTIVTNNIEIASLLAQTDLEVYVCGGQLSREIRMCLIGEDAKRLFLNMNADFVFFSAHSLSEDGIISDWNREETGVREAMMINAACKVFLCDSSKFGSRSRYHQCALADLDILISEGNNARQFAHCSDTLKLL